MVYMDCVEFKKEKAGDLPPPQHVIQDYDFIDLGGWTLPPPVGGTKFGNTAGMRIIPNVAGSGTLQNHLFIGQGKVEIIPTKDKLKEISEKLQKEVSSFQVSTVGKHYFGPPGQPIITAYDCDRKEIHSAKGSQVQGISENLLLMGEEICYIIIHGCEVAIEKICFFYV